MANTVFDVLKEKIELAKQDSKEFLEVGGPKDYASYRETVGVIRGLDTTLREIKDLAKRYEDDDDE